jgi:hypothetical protein
MTVEIDMFERTRSRIAGLAGLLGHAAAAGSAVGDGRRPKARDLKALGIDPRAFGEIGPF